MLKNKIMIKDNFFLFLKRDRNRVNKDYVDRIVYHKNDNSPMDLVYHC